MNETLTTTEVPSAVETGGAVTSKDGTRIAFSRAGSGPPLILVDGALCSRAFGPMPKLAPLLAERFSVFTYDRRGRGESGDTAPYAIEREVEDLEALVHAAGGSAYLYGASSGAHLALEAAKRTATIQKLAMYEPPWIVDDSRPPVPEDYLPTLNALVAADRRGDAVKLFMGVVGVPSIMRALMPLMPMWGKLKAVAHTLPYDGLILKEHQTGTPLRREEWAAVATPSLVIVGGKSPAWMHHATQALADVLSDSRYRTLEGQTHMVKPKPLVPVLTEFFEVSE
jgi:pimeloyl-ACP methyl ester carboxylesterase